MKKTTQSIVFALIASLSLTMPAWSGEELDRRESLNLTASEKHHLLSEMRTMLGSIQGILTGIGTEDRDLIMRSAREAGMQMTRGTPQSLKQKLPPAFKEIGPPTHMMFDELAVRAETDDMATLAEFTGQLMRKCQQCHAKFKAD
ncbi:hypothetical protein [Thiorhodococcus minor]|uniref:Cytochrome c n=1 Tax=Thiorhodococcus minor TaxID=57489 RepID=A0A6M0K5I5_9GAMM|nr:hypothetical protein [Thiorhodococcus minor]NEV64689.1 hypothetical protein [Thiorhodococcus minor]